MNENLLIIDLKTNLKLSYKETFNLLKSSITRSKTLSNNIAISEFIIHFLHLILSNKDVILVDRENFHLEDISKNQESYILDGILVSDFYDFRSKISSSKSQISILTSGTTGQPKLVTHSISSLTREVRIGNKYENKVWGLAYVLTHMAGLQVFFQALFNQNLIVNVFEIKKDLIFDSLDFYKITNIAATPTFYRLLFPCNTTFTSIESVSLGGEKSDSELQLKIKLIFPNAKLYNIYASTEAGPLFASKSDVFIIPTEILSYVKIVDDELLIHKKLLGSSSSFFLNEDWYHTGDIIEWVDQTNGFFKIISKKNELINIGGNKINPHEIESLIVKMEGIIDAFVYSKNNPITGNILMAQIVRSNENITENHLKGKLSEILPNYKIPRIIKFVSSLNITNTGKLKRINNEK